MTERKKGVMFSNKSGGAYADRREVIESELERMKPTDQPVVAERCVDCGHETPQAGNLCTAKVRRQGITDDGHWANCGCLCVFSTPQRLSLTDDCERVVYD